MNSNKFSYRVFLALKLKHRKHHFTKFKFSIDLFSFTIQCLPFEHILSIQSIEFEKDILTV